MDERSIKSKMIWLMPRITRGGRLSFKKGMLSIQLKENMPYTSIYLRVESIAVGVEIKRMTKRVIACNKILLKRKTPRLDPPTFFHMISIGSLAWFTIRTCSNVAPLFAIAKSSSLN